MEINPFCLCQFSHFSLITLIDFYGVTVHFLEVNMGVVFVIITSLVLLTVCGAWSLPRLQRCRWTRYQQQCQPACIPNAGSQPTPCLSRNGQDIVAEDARCGISSIRAIELYMEPNAKVLLIRLHPEHRIPPRGGPWAWKLMAALSIVGSSGSPPRSRPQHRQPETRKPHKSRMAHHGARQCLARNITAK